MAKDVNSTNQRLVSFYLETEKMKSVGLVLPHWYSREDIFGSDHWDRLQTIADVLFSSRVYHALYQTLETHWGCSNGTVIFLTCYLTLPSLQCCA